MLIVWKRWLEPLIIVRRADPRGADLHHGHHARGPAAPRCSTPRDLAGRFQLPVRSRGCRRCLLGNRRRAVLAHPPPLAPGSLVALGVIIPVCVGLARIYRGMHYFSDVIFGALLGGASVIATIAVLRHAAARHEVEEQHSAPKSTRRRSTHPCRYRA